MAQRGTGVSVYDPQASGPARKILGSTVEYSASMERCVAGSRVVFILTPWKEFQSLSPALFENSHGVKPVVIDCWRVLNPKAWEGRAKLLRLGCYIERGPAQAPTARPDLTASLI